MPNLHHRTAPPPWSRLALLSSLAIVAMAVPTRAAVPTTGSAYSDRVDVTVVSLDVRVTDKDGRPVRGLRADDFEIFEDGEPVEITHFAEISPATVASDRAVASPDAPDLGTPTIDARTPADSREPLWTVLFVDNLNLRRFDRQRAIDAVGQVMPDGLDPASKILVATNDNGALTVRLPFSSDPERLSATLAELQSLPCGGQRHDTDRRQVLGFLDGAESSLEALQHLRPYADQILGEVDASLAALGRLVDDLAGLPGTKIVVHVSSGLHLSAAADLFLAMEHKFRDNVAFQRMIAWDASREFELLAERASAHDVAIYPLDASGLRDDAADWLGGSQIQSAALRTSLASDQRTNLQLSLRQIADLTGGQALLNTNAFDRVLRTAAEDVRSYYSLAYVPDHSGDGKTHRFKVRVERSGVEVRHRHTYVDKSASQQMIERTRASLLHGVDDNPMSMELETHAAKPRDADTFEIPIDIAIPIDELVLLKTDDRYEGIIRFFFATRGPDGATSDVVESTIPIRLPLAAKQAPGPVLWRMKRTLLVGDGPHQLSVSVLDELGARSSSLVAEIEPTVGPSAQ